MGISQSLFAQYIGGAKKPSQKRLDDIYATIRAIGLELANTKRSRLNAGRQYSTPATAVAYMPP